MKEMPRQMLQLLHLNCRHPLHPATHEALPPHQLSIKSLKDIKAHRLFATFSTHRFWIDESAKNKHSKVPMKMAMRMKMRMVRHRVEKEVQHITIWKHSKKHNWGKRWVVTMPCKKIYVNFHNSINSWNVGKLSQTVRRLHQLTLFRCGGSLLCTIKVIVWHWSWNLSHQHY